MAPLDEYATVRIIPILYSQMSKSKFLIVGATGPVGGDQTSWSTPTEVPHFAKRRRRIDMVDILLVRKPLPARTKIKAT